MKLPIDDIFKAVMKQLNNKGNQKARYELLQKTKGITTTGSSKVTAKPKLKTKPKPKSNTKPKPKPKGSGTTDGRPTGRIARTTPPRPRRDYYPKGKTVPQTDAEKRAAEREANRLLRQSGLPTAGSKSKPSGNAKPVDVRGSIIKPPSKATLRPPAPRGSSAFEADRTVAEIRADLAKYGIGRKPPKGKNK
jgi:hypothetical protein